MGDEGDGLVEVEEGSLEVDAEPGEGSRGRGGEDAVEEEAKGVLDCDGTEAHGGHKGRGRGCVPRLVGRVEGDGDNERGGGGIEGLLWV